MYKSVATCAVCLESAWLVDWWCFNRSGHMECTVVRCVRWTKLKSGHRPAVKTTTAAKLPLDYTQARCWGIAGAPHTEPGTAHPQVVVLSWFITRCHVAWGKFESSCPSSPPAYLPPAPEGELIVHAPGASCSMQAKPWPLPHLNCISFNAMTGIWSAGCAVSPPRTKSNFKISKRGCGLPIWRRYSVPVDSDGMAILNVAMFGWRKSRSSNAIGKRDRCCAKKSQPEVTRMDCIALDPRPTLFRQEIFEWYPERCHQSAHIATPGTNQVRHKLNSDEILMMIMIMMMMTMIQTRCYLCR